MMARHDAFPNGAALCKSHEVAGGILGATRMTDDVAGSFTFI